MKKKLDTYVLKIKDQDKIFVEVDHIIEIVKKASEDCVKDYRGQRERFIQEQIGSGEDVDIRFERDYTKNVEKNLNVMGEIMTKYLSEMKEEYLRSEDETEE